MTGDPVARVRAEASRGDYASMARLASALYAQGLGPREVLRECYGVGLPEELFVIAGARRTSPRLLAYFTNQPWALCEPLDRGGPRPSALKLTGAWESKLFARDPDLVPLMVLIGHGAGLSDTTVCYRLTRLRAGSSAVFGIKENADLGEPVVPVGESLLAALLAHHIGYLRHKEWIIQQPWERGAGAYNQRDVDEAAQLVRRVEELQRQLGASR
jgi:hypothetical protein